MTESSAGRAPRFSINLFAVPPAWYPRLIGAAEDAGFEAAWIAEHLVTPLEYEPLYPYDPVGRPSYSPETPLADPFVALAAAAAVTQRIGLGVGVYVLPLRPPMVTARAALTVQEISGGRLLLGIGTGWLREEFDAAGEDFDNRGARADEILVMLAKLWTGKPVEHSGTHYRFRPVQLSPEPSVPIPLLGFGVSAPALRRSARLDGWYGPPHLPLADAIAARAILEAERKRAGTDGRPFTYHVRMAGEPTPENVAPYVEGGFDHLVLTAAVRHAQSVEEAATAIAALAEQVNSLSGS